MTPTYALRMIELLNEIRDSERKIVELLKEQRPKPQPGDSRCAGLAAAIRAAVGDRAFSSAELVVHCEVVPELAQAITAAVGGLNTRKLGRALRRVEGMDLDGLIVTRIGQDSSGVCWRIRLFEPDSV